jgi:lipopolysaccharide-induced tumor necrosis factor-alpha factor
VICPLCRQDTASVSRKVAGNVTWIWCFVLLVFTGCCCIPFFVDSCKDTELVCVVCQSTKSKIPANCL